MNATQCSQTYAEVVDLFTPSLDLLVTVEAATNPPVVKYSADASMLHTLVLVDPDAMAREWRHWVVHNIEGADLASGEVGTPYKGPSPRAGTGLHRYVLVLFEQSSRIAFEPFNNENKGRSRFSTREYAQRYDLRPVGIAVFTALREEKEEL